MNDELRQINASLARVANSFEIFDIDKNSPSNVVESILDTNATLDVMLLPLSNIQKTLERIANSLDRIATTYSDAEKKWGNITSLTIRTDPSDGPFCSQEPEEPEGFADME